MNDEGDPQISNGFKEKLELKLIECDKIRNDLFNKISEFDIQTKETQMISEQLMKSEKRNEEKDVLV